MRTLTYLLIFLFVCLLLAFVPKAGIYSWDPHVIIPATAAMFTFLVWLVARFIGNGRTPFEVLITASFILFFAPDSTLFFSRDEEALIALGSQCIVPFFLTQYTHISGKNFKTVYALMLLMGIFCSFTHDGITLPLCLAFLLLAWQHRGDFFRQACWPMVAGWVLGTILQFVTRGYLPDLQPNLLTLSSRTALILGLLWDTKVFILAVVLTLWFSTTHWGRRELIVAFFRHRLIAYSFCFALFIVPFAPLGIDNAVTSVCFFAMLWSMLLCKGIERHYLSGEHLKANPSAGAI